MPTKKTRTRSRVVVDPVVTSIGRLEEAISTQVGKLTDAVSVLNVTVATHAERLDNVDQRANSHSSDIHRLESSQQQISERINTVQTDLSNQIQAQTASVKAHVDGSVEKIVALVKEADQKRQDGDNAILARVAKLEIWRWMIVGGAFVASTILGAIIWKIVAAVIDKVDWFKFFGF